MTKSKIPHYATDQEIAAARAMHGAQYDKLIAKGAIKAPTTTELPHATLQARLAKAAERTAPKAAKQAKSTKSSKKRSARKRSAE